MRRIFLGCIGYRFLRDHSVGPLLLDEMQSQEWPTSVRVDVEDLAPGGPLATVHNFTDRPTYDRVVLFGAVNRGEREGGVAYAYRWTHQLPPADEIQARIAEAVTGVIGLENTLIIGQHFEIWPPETFVVEIEPIEESWGEVLSPRVGALLPRMGNVLRRLVLEKVVALPTTPHQALEGALL